MNKYHCSETRPWGIHPVVHNDELCPRCGWRAPGPKGDVLASTAGSGRAVIESRIGQRRRPEPSRRAA